MPEKKRTTYAEKAASTKKKKTTTTKKTKNEEPVKKTEVQEQVLPTRFITSTVFLALFIFFLAVYLSSGGVLNQLFEGIILGLIGWIGYIVSIPAFLYLFVIHAFSNKRPVKMRSICVGVFVLMCGCIAHLVQDTQGIEFGADLLSDLYIGGSNGTAGGVVCGSIAMLLRWLCDDILSWIIFTVTAVLTLLGAMQITIPSLVRAIKNRPRADWEDEEYETRPEPAAIVVNHIANKHIAYEKQRRDRELQEDVEFEVEQLTIKAPKGKKKESKVSDMMRQIDTDVESPVSAAGVAVEDATEEEIVAPEVKQPEKEPEIISESMPAFDPTEAIPPAPKVVKPRKVTAKEADESAQVVAAEIAKAEAEKKSEYCYPPIDLLKLPAGGVADGTAEMRENFNRLNETLASFKIDAHVINVTRGPSVTRYEVELEKGVKLSKVTTAADDIALSLGASGVRIAAVPGKISVVGIEVPNRAVTTVSLREVIDSQEFAKAKSKSSFSVGKDIGGNCIVGNIAKLPHMLIAGTTGSGKSVCMNSIIISLLYKASPV